MIKIILSLFLFFSFLGSLQSQLLSAEEQIQLIENQLKVLKSTNDSVFQSSTEFVAGKLYYPKGNAFSHPYFSTHNWNKGTIVYQGIDYSVDLIKYDIHSDKLVFLLDNGTGAYPVALEHTFISEFEIEGHKFVYLDNIKEDLGSIADNGYYEQVYSGKSKFYVRWRKNESTNPTTMKKEYTPWNLLIVNVNGDYYRVRNESGLCRVLIGFEKDMKSFVKKNDLTISKTDYSDIYKILSHYDNL